MVKDQHNDQAPFYMFDNNPATFYHGRWRSGHPKVTVYFGMETTVTRVVIINRNDNIDQLSDLKGTQIGVLIKGSDDTLTTETCGSLDTVNTESLAVSDQTYNIDCNDKVGVGVVVEKSPGGDRLCIAEIMVYRTKGK